MSETPTTTTAEDAALEAAVNAELNRRDLALARTQLVKVTNDIAKLERRKADLEAEVERLNIMVLYGVPTA